MNATALRFTAAPVHTEAFTAARPALRPNANATTAAQPGIEEVRQKGMATFARIYANVPAPFMIGMMTAIWGASRLAWELCESIVDVCAAHRLPYKQEARRIRQLRQDELSDMRHKIMDLGDFKATEEIAEGMWDTIEPHLRALNGLCRRTASPGTDKELVSAAAQCFAVCCAVVAYNDLAEANMGTEWGVRKPDSPVFAHTFVSLRLLELREMLPKFSGTIAKGGDLYRSIHATARAMVDILIESEQLARQGAEARELRESRRRAPKGRQAAWQECETAYLIEASSSGRSVRDIAEMLGRSVKSVESKLRRIKEHQKPKQQ